MNRIRPGSLMIRILALFFGVVTAYATYVNAGRQPIAGAPAGQAAESPAADR